MGELTVKQKEEGIRKSSIEINSIQSSFEEVSQNILTFRREFQFAMQALGNNEYLLQIAMSNPQSLKNAIVNVGAIGLSLNPAEALAYLVPMDGAVQLQVSYIGFIKLGVMDGGILWAHAENVREKDSFTYNGVDLKPTHTFEPFSKERGKIIGTYCVAKTHDGSFLTRMMTYDECLAIRNRSKMWKKSPGKGPWATDESEMIKKTVIKQSRKTWPKGASSRLDKAIEVVNEFEGIDFNAEKENKEQKKVSAVSNLLNNALGTPPSPEMKSVIDSIISSCKSINSNGETKEEKQAFMLRELQVTSFNELYSKDLAHLKDLDSYLLEKVPPPPEEYPADAIQEADFTDIPPANSAPSDQLTLEAYNKLVSGIKR